MTALDTLARVLDCSVQEAEEVVAELADEGLVVITQTTRHDWDDTPVYCGIPVPQDASPSPRADELLRSGWRICKLDNHTGREAHHNPGTRDWTIHSRHQDGHEGPCLPVVVLLEEWTP